MFFVNLSSYRMNLLCISRATSTYPRDLSASPPGTSIFTPIMSDEIQELVEVSCRRSEFPEPSFDFPEDLPTFPEDLPKSSKNLSGFRPNLSGFPPNLSWVFAESVSPSRAKTLM